MAPIEASKNAQLKLSLLPQAAKVTALQLGMKLIALGVGAYFWEYIEGPLVETFYFTLNPNTPLAKIMGKNEDMALATGRDSAVIIREKQQIGIQLSRNKSDRQKVDFNECLFALAPKLMASAIPILLGKTHRGEYAYLDLASEPHALIAGSTGSGKSMFLLSTICTLAVCKRPDELKIIVVDSKQLDLVLVQGLPHIQKICRNALELHESLDMLINELRRRNNLMSGIARNLDEYNKIQAAQGCDPLPRILLLVDEFANIVEEDLSQAKAKIEPYASLSRIGDRVSSLAQLSRASGIHIVIATQRPTVEVVTGNLKTNLPARIAFKLTSSIDSKTILKEVGAEKLLGQGDMLVQSASSEQMFRAHAPFVELDTLGAILYDVDMIRNMLIKSCAPLIHELDG